MPIISPGDDPDQDDLHDWLVLVNAEQQYSLWPVIRSIPDGWTEAGAEGSRSDCLAWVDQHWSDMRPSSLRPA